MDGGGERHIRLNYTRSSNAVIQDGIRRLGELIARRTEAAVPERSQPVLVAGGPT